MHTFLGHIKVDQKGRVRYFQCISVIPSPSQFIDVCPITRRYDIHCSNETRLKLLDPSDSIVVGLLLTDQESMSPYLSRPLLAIAQVQQKINAQT